MAFDGLKKHLGAAAEFATDKASEAGAVISEKAADAGEFLAEKAKEGQELVSLKQHEARMRYYNPRFREQFFSADFDLPRVIVIVDGDDRKGIDVCEGAIGWISNSQGMEVLHLYEEFVGESGLNFYPVPLCDAVYYADSFDVQRFINLSCLFDVAQKDRITELRNIARDLGARHCKIESYESKKEVTLKKGGGAAKAKGKPVGEVSGEIGLSQDASQFTELSVVFEQSFEGAAEPKRPTLRWFSHDREIRSLIETMCSDEGNRFKEYRIEIDGSSSATLSQKQAAKIDGVLKKLHASCNFTMESECLTESRQKLRFTISFLQ